MVCSASAFKRTLSVGSACSHENRAARLYKIGGPDQRSPFARDRDRILYTSAFHRLAGITQIVRAGEEEVFHTRQQHSIKVAQVGRRLAEFVIDQYPSQSKLLGIDSAVVVPAAVKGRVFSEMFWLGVYECQRAMIAASQEGV